MFQEDQIRLVDIRLSFNCLSFDFCSRLQSRCRLRSHLRKSATNNTVCDVGFAAFSSWPNTGCLARVSRGSFFFEHVSRSDTHRESLSFPLIGLGSGVKVLHMPHGFKAPATHHHTSQRLTSKVVNHTPGTRWHCMQSFLTVITTGATFSSLLL